MIEVKARLLRGCTYLAGETIECEIVFTHIANNPETTSNSSCSDVDARATVGKCVLERLAWGSAQIHCQCSANETRIIFPKRLSQNPCQLSPETVSSSTSFVPSRGEHGQCVLATPPKILFCDLELSPGESKVFVYQDSIPCKSPPSYRGHAIKYSYKVAIGTSRIHAPPRVLRLPLRILFVPGLEDMRKSVSDREIPNNPFLECSTKTTSLLDIGVDYLNSIASRKKSHVYNITSTKGTVGKFSLFKSAYRIGEEIIGTFDFSECFIPCYKYRVVLQSEENIAHEYIHSKQSLGVMLTSYSSVYENCLHTKKTHFVLPIPVTASPEFSSDLVSLKWRLHFEFVIASNPLPAGSSPVQTASPHADIATWQGPSDIDVEAMMWDLPIKVMATSPLKTSLSSARTSNSIVF